MDSKSLNNTQVNTDFYKLQQDYNSLRSCLSPITDRNRFNENKIDHINQETHRVFREHVRCFFVAIDDNWKYFS
jgi:hypothetical protein